MGADDGIQDWYDANEGDYTEAAGVSQWMDEDYMSRVRKAAAPLTPVGSIPNQTGQPDDPKDLVWAARKAAQEAASAASYMTQNTKAYEKLSVPPFPKNAEMTNWIYSLGTAAVVSGCFGDEKK